MSEATQSLTSLNKWASIKPVFLNVWTLVVLLPILVAIFNQPNFLPVIRFASGAFLNTLPYIAFAVLLIASLKAAGAESVIANAFKGRENRMILFAALFGGLAPFCSCEVIPFIAGLLALGAPLSAVMAFWLSSPLIDPPTLLITAAALGWPFAAGKAIAAVALGLFGGFVIKMLISGGAFANPLKEYKTKSCGCGPNPFSGKPEWTFWREADRRTVFKNEFLENALFLVKWLALAYVLEALLVTYVPASLIANLVGGDGILTVGMAALVGMPAYLNSYVAPPLVAGLMDQGMGTGAAMAFMVAGAVSSIPAMAAVYSLVKPRVFGMYVLLGILGAIASGLVYQFAIQA